MGAFVVCSALGCARLLPGGKRTAAVGSAATASDAPSIQFLGTVHVIGTDGRFVLVQSPVAALVAGLVDGQALVCRAGGNVTATLHVSRERRPPFVVADVITGAPTLGDEVFIEPVGNRSTPAPTAPAAPTPEFRANPPLPSGR